MSTIPDENECVELLKRAGCEENVIRHVKAVTRLAVKMAEKCGANVELVRAGAMLHDIGRGKTHGIEHGVVGAQMLREWGYTEELARIVERHIGAGIDENEAEKLGLPKKSYIPETIEEKIVAEADNYAGEGEEGIKRIAERLIKKGNKRAAKRVLRLHEEMKRCIPEEDLL